MKPNYKPIKEYTPFCPACEERLSGNNSILLPYWCGCGVWQSDWNNPLDFTIIPHSSKVDYATTTQNYAEQE